MLRTTHPVPLRLAPFALALAGALALPAHARADAPAAKDPSAATSAGERADDASRRVIELAREAGIDSDRIKSIHVATGAPALATRPRLGVLLGVDEQSGVRITGVTPGGGADKAGLKAGDRLLRIRGKAIDGGSGEQRVENARKALADLERDKPVRLTYQRDGRQHEADVTPGATQAVVFARTVSRKGGDGDAITVLDGEDIARLRELGPQLRGEVLRLSRRDCKDEDCGAPLLAEALRWDGLNLLALEPQLGRYFGAERGVLVLSQGALPGLQAGDVIQAIEGKEVASPREAMRAMSAKKPGEQARLRVLRDRSQRELLVAVPERMRSLDFIPMPPAPPAPPVPAATPSAAPVPPAPPAKASAALL